MRSSSCYIQDGDLVLVVAPMAAEIGREIAALVSEPTISEQLSREFGAGSSERDLLHRLEADARAAVAAGPAAGAQAAAAVAAVSAAAGALPQALPGLLMMLERLGSLIVEFGAPARFE